MTADLPTFDELVDLLRERLGMADALNLSEFHSFKKLMAHEAEANLIADNWYWEAFEELEANGHLNPASHKAMGFDAHARLSADGYLYLRTQTESS